MLAFPLWDAADCAYHTRRSTLALHAMLCYAVLSGFAHASHLSLVRLYFTSIYTPRRAFAAQAENRQQRRRRRAGGVRLDAEQRIETRGGAAAAAAGPGFAVGGGAQVARRGGPAESDRSGTYLPVFFLLFCRVCLSALRFADLRYVYM